MNRRITTLCMLAPMTLGAVATAQPPLLQLSGVPDFSQAHLIVWRNSCAPVCGADVAFYLSKTYPSLRQGAPWGPGSAADAGADAAIGSPLGPSPSLSTWMGTSVRTGTTLAQCAAGLDTYLETYDGRADVTWNTTAQLLNSFHSPMGLNFFAQCQQTLADGGVVILAIHWPGGVPIGYDLPDNYLPIERLESPMGHAVTLTGYNAWSVLPTISINDPANNALNAHNWSGEDLILTTGALPDALTVQIGGQTARIYGAVLSTPRVQQIGSNQGFGTPWNEGALAIASTNDGGSVITGYIESPLQRGNDILVAKLDHTGNLEWAGRFGGLGDDIGYSIQQTMDGGYIIGAETDATGPDFNLALLRLDQAGDQMWARSYFGDTSSEELVLDNSSGVSVRETPQGTFLLTGRKLTGTAGQAGLLLHTDRNGIPIWQSLYSDPRQPLGGKITFTDVRISPLGDDSIFVSGTQSFDSPTIDRPLADPLLMRIDFNGQPIFMRRYDALVAGVAGAEWGTADGLAVLPDGAVIMDGRTNIGVAQSTHMQVMLTDLSGNLLWISQYFDKYSTYRTIHQDPQGFVAIGGVHIPVDGDVPESMLMLIDPAAAAPLYANSYGLLTAATGMAPLLNGFGLTGPINLYSPPPLFGNGDFEVILTDPTGQTQCRQKQLETQSRLVDAMQVQFLPLVASVQAFAPLPGQFYHFALGSADLCCPPCAADFNEDGGVDGADVGAFFQDWENGMPCADVNLDGGVDGSDVDTFFFYWEAGGC
jgi:hypothetical protein